MKTLSVSLLIATIMHSQIALAELTGEGGLLGSQPATSSSSGSQMPASKISCLLQASGTDSAQANETAKNIYAAVQKLKLDGSKFTDTAMIHFLAQIKAESLAGKNLTENSKGTCGSSPTPNATNKGYGLIQVTGADNLKAAEDCINAAQPGAGNGVSTNPENTVGNCATNKEVPAMASLCWWKKNVMDNPANDQLERDPSDAASTKLTHVVNGGSVNAQLSTAAASKLEERTSGFDKMISKERLCGDPLVSSL